MQTGYSIVWKQYFIASYYKLFWRKLQLAETADYACGA
jgi:hypothetical protein